MTRRVLVSHRLPELRSGDPALDRWVNEHLQRHIAEVFEQLAFLTPEIGTWTPVVRGSGTAGTYELATAIGFYQRHGDYVDASFYVVFAGALTAGGTNDLHITGLPFEKPEMAEGDYFPAGSVVTSGIDATAATVSMSLGFSSGDESATLRIVQNIDNAAAVVLPIAAVAVNDQISGSIRFQAGDRSA